MLKKIKFYLFVLLLLIPLVLVSFADNGQTNKVEIYFNYHQAWVKEKSTSPYDFYSQKCGIESRKVTAIKNENGLYLPLSQVAQISDWTFTYDSKKKSLTIRTIDSKTISLNLNSKACYLNGQLFKLRNSVINISGKLYLPEDFFCSVLKYKIKQDSNLSEMITNWRVLYTDDGNYWWNSDSLILYKKSANYFSTIVAENVKPRKENYLSKTYDNTIISGIKSTPKGNIIVSFRNVFYDTDKVGSPFNDQDYVDLFYINSENKKLLNMGTTLDKANGYGFVDDITLIEGDNVVLPGDNGFIVIDDETGMILKKYMLKDLLKNDKNYIWKRVDYIHFDRDRIICRTQGPKNLQYGPISFYIAMIDLKSGNVRWINEELIKLNELEIYYNDEYHLLLGFKGIENNQLKFIYNNIYEKVKKIIFFNFQT